MKSSAKSGVRSAARELAHFLPTSLWRRLFPKSAIGVCYHMVSDSRLPHLKHYPILSVAEFESDLDYLQRAFGFISYDQLLERRMSLNDLRDNSVALTFDDGFAECANVVAPILLRRGIACVFFVIADLIDNKKIFSESAASLCIDAVLNMPVDRAEAIVDSLDFGNRLQPQLGVASSNSTKSPFDTAALGDQVDPRLRPLIHWLLCVNHTELAMLDRLCLRLDINPNAYLREVQPYLTTQQIRQLRSAGFTIGAHSCSHRWLQTLSKAEAEQEIVASCRLISDITGESSVPFAFPYFGGGIDRAWLAELRHQHDVIGLFFDTDGLREDESFVVQRVFGERFSQDRTIDAILRRAWSRPQAWRSPR